MIVQNSVHIDAPGEKIWPYLVEPEKILQWCITFRSFEYTGEPAEGVGTPIHIDEKAAGPTMSLDFVASEWVEGEKITIQKVSGTMPKNYTQEWIIDRENGGSRFTFREEIVMPWGPLGKLIERVAEGSSQATVAKMLKILKGLVEG